MLDSWLLYSVHGSVYGSQCAADKQIKLRCYIEPPMFVACELWWENWIWASAPHTCELLWHWRTHTHSRANTFHTQTHASNYMIKPWVEYVESGTTANSRSSCHQSKCSTFKYHLMHAHECSQLHGSMFSVRMCSRTRLLMSQATHIEIDAHGLRTRIEMLAVRIHA